MIKKWIKKNIKYKKSKNKKTNKIFIKNVIKYASLTFAICLVYVSTLFIPFMQNKLQTVSNKRLFMNPTIPSISIRQFGITMFGLLDVKNYFLPAEQPTEYVFSEEEPKEEKKTRTFDDANWENLIEEETNETIEIICSQIKNAEFIQIPKIINLRTN